MIARDTTRPARSSAGWMVCVAAALSLEAGIIHLLAAPEHALFWWGYGVFFVATGIGQVLFAFVAPWRAGTRLLLAGIVLNFSIIVVYVVSRTSGIPFLGPHAWRAEWPGALDMLATVSEFGVVALLVACLDAARRRVTINLLFAAAGVLWILRFLGVLTERF